MKSNKLRIDCKDTGEISYLFLSERGWGPVSKSSALFREEYRHTPVYPETAREVFGIISRDYSLGGGVDIQFRGPKDVYEIFRGAAQELSPDGRLRCQKLTDVVIAVAGRIRVGKTVLIRALKRVAEEKDRDSAGNLCCRFLELQGIDIGDEYIEHAKNELEHLRQENGVNCLIYCLESGKVDPAEKHFLQYVTARYPQMTVLAVLPRCIDAAAEQVASDISALLDGMQVIPVLAEELNTKVGVIQPYGVDEVLDAVYRQEAKKSG